MTDPSFPVICGYVGLILGAARNLPQLVLTLRTRSLGNLSVWFLGCNFAAASLALIYEIASGRMGSPHSVLYLTILFCQGTLLVLSAPGRRTLARGYSPKR